MSRQRFIKKCCAVCYGEDGIVVRFGRHGIMARLENGISWNSDPANAIEHI